GYFFAFTNIPLSFLIPLSTAVVTSRIVITTSCALLYSIHKTYYWFSVVTLSVPTLPAASSFFFFLLPYFSANSTITELATIISATQAAILIPLINFPILFFDFKLL